MTAKEKAREMLNDMAMEIGTIPNALVTSIARRCAIIAVNEIIATDMLIDEEVYVNTVSYLNFWLDVLTELKAM